MWRTLRFLQITLLTPIQVTLVTLCIAIYPSLLADLMDPREVSLRIAFRSTAIICSLLSFQAFLIYNLLSVLCITPIQFKSRDTFFYKIKKGSLALCLLSLSWGLLLSFFGIWVSIPLFVHSVEARTSNDKTLENYTRLRENLSLETCHLSCHDAPDALCRGDPFWPASVHGIKGRLENFRSAEA